MSERERGSLDPPSASELGTAIRTLRAERKLSLERLATAAGIHWTYLSGIERGIRNPTWKVLSSIARGLGIEVSELARRAEEVAAGG